MIEFLKIHKWHILCVIGVAILLIVAIVWGKKRTPKTVECASIEYQILDGKKRQYVDSCELNLLLEKEHLYPVGKPIGKVSLHRMEQLIKAHPMVRTAECFLTPQNKLIVQLTQRVPLLLVETEKETYYIDTQRNKMEARMTIKDKVLKVQGQVTEEMASTDLADMAVWLKSNAYWQNQLGHIEMQDSTTMYVCLSDTTQPRVLMGEIDGYASKLEKLRVYLEKGGEATKDKHYTELDLRFKGQVIGRISAK